MSIGYEKGHSTSALALRVTRERQSNYLLEQQVLKITISF